MFKFPKIQLTRKDVFSASYLFLVLLFFSFFPLFFSEFPDLHRVIAEFALVIFIIFDSIENFKNKQIPEKILLFAVFSIDIYSIYYPYTAFRLMPENFEVVFYALTFFLIIETLLFSKTRHSKSMFFAEELRKQNLRILVSAASVSISVFLSLFLLEIADLFPVLILFFPFFVFNSKLILLLEKRINDFAEKAGIEITKSLTFDKILNARTAVFDSSILFKGKPILGKISHRATISKETVLNAVFSMIPDLVSGEEKYVLDFQPSLNDVQKDEIEISGRDSEGKIYTLSTRVENENNHDFSHILYKDQIPVAKIRVEREYHSELSNAISTLNDLNFNTVCVSPENENIFETSGVFDKIYGNHSEKESKELITRLSEKAPCIVFGKEYTEREGLNFVRGNPTHAIEFISKIFDLKILMSNYRIVWTTAFIAGLTVGVIFNKLVLSVVLLSVIVLALRYFFTIKAEKNFLR